MRLFISATLTLLIFSFSEAQNLRGTGFKSYLVEQVKGDYTYDRKLVVSETGENCFYLNLIGSKLFLIKYGSKLTEELRVNIVPDILPKGTEIMSTIWFNNNVVLSYKKKRIKGTKDVGILVLNQEGLDVMLRQDLLTFNDNSGEIIMTTSPNRERLGLMAYYGSPMANGGPSWQYIYKSGARVIVLDKDFDEILNQRVALGKNSAELIQFSVDNMDNAFVLTMDQDKGVNSFYVQKFEEEEEKIRQRVTLNSGDVRSVRFTFDDDQDIVLIGSMREKENYTMDGLFFQKLLNDDLSVEGRNVHHVDDTFIKQNLTNNDIRAWTHKGAWAANSFAYAYGEFKVIKLNQTSNGFNIIMELCQKSVTGTTDGSSTTFRYADVFIARFDKNGQLLWKNKVVKKQKFVNHRYGGSHAFISEHGIKILFTASSEEIKSYRGVAKRQQVFLV